MTSQHERFEAFRQLHARPGLFVIPNPWDRGSARLLAHLGFRALATTSSGYQFTRGCGDTVWGTSVDDVLAHVADRGRRLGFGA